MHLRDDFEITYSYPSSPNAVAYGFAKQGCYTVARVKNRATHYIAAFATKAEAEADIESRQADLDAAPSELQVNDR
jgi:hypothetical protein